MSGRRGYLRACPLGNLIVSHAAAAVVKHARGWRTVASCNFAGCVRPSLTAICLLTFVISAAQSEESTGPVATVDPLAWPAVTQTARPWTRWWWLGSAV